MEHELKILPQYFKAVKEGTKTFEIRKNDRGFKVGDTILLKEINFDNKNKYTKPHYTGQEIIKEVSYILEGGQYGLEEGYCISGLKEPLNSVGNCARCGRTIINHEECDCKFVPIGIELKNIDLTTVSKDDQMKKLKEEYTELLNAYCDYIIDRTKENKSHLIEEYFDLIQTPLGLLEKEGITANEVMKEYDKHLKKIKLRPRKKECSKCIYSFKMSDRPIYSCNKLDEIIYAEYAPTCKHYKEKE